MPGTCQRAGLPPRRGPRRRRWAGRLRTISSSTIHSSRVGIWPSCGEVTTGGGRRRKHQRIFRQRRRLGEFAISGPVQIRLGDRTPDRSSRSSQSRHSGRRTCHLPTVSRPAKPSASAPADLPAPSAAHRTMTSSSTTSWHRATTQSCRRSAKAWSSKTRTASTALSTAPASAGRYCARTMSSPSVTATSWSVTAPAARPGGVRRRRRRAGHRREPHRRRQQETAAECPFNAAQARFTAIIGPLGWASRRCRRSSPAWPIPPPAT